MNRFRHFKIFISLSILTLVHWEIFKLNSAGFALQIVKERKHVFNTDLCFSQ